MVRTTTAVTMIDGGIKANVLPREAAARVNFRLLPGDTSAAVIEHVRRAIDDPEIEIEVETVNEASPVADVKSDAFALLAQVIAESAPDAVVSPALVVGGTDTQHYSRISDNGFRFLPVRFGAKDFERVHGRDERLSVENVRFAVEFYERLVRRVAGEPEGGRGRNEGPAHGANQRSSVCQASATVGSGAAAANSSGGSSARPRRAPARPPRRARPRERTRALERVAAVAGAARVRGTEEPVPRRRLAQVSSRSPQRPAR